MRPKPNTGGTFRLVRAIAVPAMFEMIGNSGVKSSAFGIKTDMRFSQLHLNNGHDEILVFHHAH
jgi:hypothetical protein